MKKYIICIIALSGILATTFTRSKIDTDASNLAMLNAEAIANGESSGSSGPSVSLTCGGTDSETGKGCEFPTKLCSARNPEEECSQELCEDHQMEL